jgi:hypothetical protein
MAGSMTTLSLWRTSAYQVRTLFVRRLGAQVDRQILVWKIWTAAVPAFDMPIGRLIRSHVRP